MNRLIVLFIDAFRYDYLSAMETPFLHDMAKTGFSSPVKTLLGYSDAIDASIFTGVMPREHGHWIMHRYQPEDSPLSFFSSLSFIDHIPSDFIRRGIKFTLSATLGRFLAGKYGYNHLSTHNIPYHVIGNFGWTTRKDLLSPNPFPGLPTIFDLFREGGVPYAYIDAAALSLRHRYSSSARIRERLLGTIRSAPEDTRLYFIYLHHLDHFAHRHRTDSAVFRQELKEMDHTAEALIRQARADFGDDFAVMVVSDHGMADTETFVNLKSLTGDKGFGRDFLLFLDSTMIHVWYLNTAKKDEVRRRIEGLDCGRFISASEKELLGVDFENRDYGDEVYLLEPGYSIFPNFMSWLVPYAMHAYHPDHETQRGIMLVEGPGLDYREAGLVNILDIGPSLLDMLGLPIPDHFQGQSVLRRENVPAAR